MLNLKTTQGVIAQYRQPFMLSVYSRMNCTLILLLFILPFSIFSQYDPYPNYSYNIPSSTGPVIGEASSAIKSYPGYQELGGESDSYFDIIPAGKFNFVAAAYSFFTGPQYTKFGSIWLAKVCALTGQDITARGFSPYAVRNGSYPDYGTSITEECFGLVHDKKNNYLYAYGYVSDLNQSYIACFSGVDLSLVTSFGSNGVKYFPTSDGVIGGISLMELANGSKIDLLCLFSAPQTGPGVLESIKLQILDGSLVVYTQLLNSPYHHLSVGKGLVKKLPRMVGSIYNEYIVAATARENSILSGNRTCAVVLKINVNNSNFSAQIAGATAINYDYPLIGNTALNRIQPEGAHSHFGDISFTANLSQIDVVTDGVLYRVFPGQINPNYSYPAAIQISSVVWGSASPPLIYISEISSCATRKDGSTLVSLHTANPSWANGGLGIVNPGSNLNLSPVANFCILHHTHNVKLDEFENVILTACAGNGANPNYCQVTNQWGRGAGTGKYEPTYNHFAVNFTFSNQTLTGQNHFAMDYISLLPGSKITSGTYGLYDPNCFLGTQKGEDNPQYNTTINDGKEDRAYLPKVYPNPNNGTIYVSYEEFSGIKMVLELYDISGRRVFSQSFINENEARAISLQNLSNGLYFYKLFSDDKVIHSDKLILNRD